MSKKPLRILLLALPLAACTRGNSSVEMPSDPSTVTTLARPSPTPSPTPTPTPTPGTRALG